MSKKTEKPAAAPAADQPPIEPAPQPEPNPNPPVVNEDAPPEPNADDAPPPETPQEPEILTGREDPLLASLFRDLDGEVEIKPVPEPEKDGSDDKDGKEKAAEEEAKAKADAEAKAKLVPAKPPKKKRVEILPDEPLPEPVTVPITTAPAKPAPAPAPDPDAAYVASLTEDQAEELRDANWAEANLPQRYQGHAKKLVDWYKKFDSWVVKAREENPERSFDENDEGFVEFMKGNKPRFAVGDYRKIQAGRIREEATAEASRAVEPKLQEIQRKQKELEARPGIESVVKQFDDGLTELLADKKEGEDNPVAAAAELLRKEPAKAATEYPMETEMIEHARKRWEPLTREYLRFAHGVVPFDPSNRTHAELLDFVNQEGETFAAQGGKYRTQAGKTFLPRAKYGELLRSNPEEAKKFWTFTHRQILEIMAVRAKNEVNHAVSEMRKRMEAFGYTPKARNGTAEPPKVTPEPTPLNPPKAKPSAAPGSAKSGKNGAPTGNEDAIDVRRTLYPAEA